MAITVEQQRHCVSFEDTLAYELAPGVRGRMRREHLVHGEQLTMNPGRLQHLGESITYLSSKEHGTIELEQALVAVVAPPMGNCLGVTAVELRVGEHTGRGTMLTRFSPDPRVKPATICTGLDTSLRIGALDEIEHAGDPLWRTLASYDRETDNLTILHERDSQTLVLAAPIQQFPEESVAGIANDELKLWMPPARDVYAYYMSRSRAQE